MAFAIRRRADSAPALSSPSALTVRRESDVRFMAALQDRTEAEIQRRFDEGHRAYVASWEGEPAAWGWVATRAAEIGELRSRFTIPAGERYLWNFVTLGSHRGLGIYPRLLDAIVRAESAEADRFWIGYAPENHASGSGIRRAGFTSVAELSFDADGQPALRPTVEEDGAALARLLGLPVAAAPLSVCWRCARAQPPRAMFCAEGECSCDYQRPERECSAGSAHRLGPRSTAQDRDGVPARARQVRRGGAR